MQGNYPRLAEFDGVELLDVYRKLTPADINAVIDFWLRNRSLPAGLTLMELRRRANEVVVAVLREDAIVALGSAHVDFAPHDGQQYYFYRDFFGPNGATNSAADSATDSVRRALLTQSYTILKAWEPRYLPRKPFGVLVSPQGADVLADSELQAGSEIGFFILGLRPGGAPVVGRKFDESVTEHQISPGTSLPVDSDV
ncbi:hypothetical protein M0G74_11380 [Microbulbifer sp. CAU 1566]|uniref:hypothetical protein n=1 Tax=Microbulbifer sp. CAU 1566 TaxID=2933269 RepID=UPI0020067363|nr:hypothetical protein [Microbulbifer sp. CAU 1566]MCK7597873.1 hypothetical protein [Microbulbifer sp. CAU 1566]